MFTKHVRGELYEDNKCLYIIRRLACRKEDCGQLNNVVRVIVLPKITYRLSLYRASESKIAVQWFLKHCSK